MYVYNFMQQPLLCKSRIISQDGTQTILTINKDQTNTPVMEQATTNKEYS